MKKIIRVLLTTIILSAGLYAYCLFAVPFIELESTVSYRTGSMGYENDDISIQLKRLFPPDAWELKQSRRIKLSNAHFLLDDYNISSDSKIVVNKCTIIIIDPDQSLSDSKRFEKSIVIHCIEGAVLQFERSPFETGISGSSNRFLGGLLKGNVYADYKGEPHNTNDDWHIATRDVHLENDRAWTNAIVEFSFGRSRGQGANMSIQMINQRLIGASLPGSSIQSPISGRIERLDLRKLNYLTIYLPPKKEEDKTADSPLLDPNVPIEVRCEGTVSYNVLQKTASLSNNVSMFRTVPGHQPDTLLAEVLNIYFKQAQKKDDAVENAPAEQNDPSVLDPDEWNLEVDRFEAIGKPVILSSTDYQLQLKGNKIACNLNPLSFELEAINQAEINYREHKISTQNMLYTFAQDNKLGSMQCNCPGWIQSQLGNGEQTVRLRWGERLTLIPDPTDPQEHLISLKTNAHLDFGADIQRPEVLLQSSNMYFWLSQVQSPESVQESSNNELSSLSLTRMQAEGDVELKSKQLAAKVNKLQLWFNDTQQTLPETENQNAYSLENSSGTGINPSAGGNPAADPENNSLSLTQYIAAGDILQGKVLRNKAQIHVSEIILLDNVQVYEQQYTNNKAKGLYMKGKRIEIFNAMLPSATAALIGSPAEVKFDSLSLYGNGININRSVNRIWIESPGKAVYQKNTPNTETSVSGTNMTLPDKAVINWRKSMIFDGESIAFDGNVSLEQENQFAQCDLLQVFLTQKIDLQNPKTDSAIQAKYVVLKNNVKLEQSAITEGKQTSIDCLAAAKLSIDLSKKNLLAEGPGRITTQRFMKSLPAMGNKESNSSESSQTSGSSESAGSSGLMYLSVDFQKQLQGDFSSDAFRTFVFQGRIESVFGPIPQFGQSLDARRLDSLPTNAFVLKCEKMEVQIPSNLSALQSEQGDQNAPKMKNGYLIASDNASVEGIKYNATAGNITYDADKGQIIMEGDGRSPAKFFYQKVFGGRYHPLSGNKINFWPKTNRVNVEGAQEFSILVPGEDENDSD